MGPCLTEGQIRPAPPFALNVSEALDSLSKAPKCFHEPTYDLMYMQFSYLERYDNHSSYHPMIATLISMPIDTHPVARAPQSSFRKHYYGQCEHFDRPDRQEEIWRSGL